MKRLLRWLFSTKSKSKKYKYELLLITYLLLISLIVIVISNTINLENLLDRILSIFILMQWMLFFVPCIIRLIDISDYNEKIKVINGEKKFKFEPVLCNISEIENWIKNALIPDTIYVKSLNGKNITIISVSYETKGKNGPFINKQILINDKVIDDLQDIKEEIYHTCMIKDDCISIMAITEYNDPKNFYKILNKNN